MSVFLPAKVCHTGYRAPFGGPRKKTGSKPVSTKHYRLQPKYWGQKHIKITVCGVPIQLNGDVLAAYLSKYGDVDG